jgi:hypothetical protein
MASGAESEFSVQCSSVGTTPAGSLVLATNENPPAQYTFTLTCGDPAASAPLFSSDPVPGASIYFDTSDQVLTISNAGPPGTFLDVNDISSHPSFTIVSGLPISGLGSGEIATVVIHMNVSANDFLVLQTNEPGSPTYSYVLAATQPAIPALSLWAMLAMTAILGAVSLWRISRV